MCHYMWIISLDKYHWCQLEVLEVVGKHLGLKHEGEHFGAV